MRKDDHRVIFAIPIQDAGATGPVEAHVTHGNDVVLASTPKWTHWASSAACFFLEPGWARTAWTRIALRRRAAPPRRRTNERVNDFLLL